MLGKVAWCSHLLGAPMTPSSNPPFASVQTGRAHARAMPWGWFEEVVGASPASSANPIRCRTSRGVDP